MKNEVFCLLSSHAEREREYLFVCAAILVDVIVQKREDLKMGFVCVRNKAKMKWVEIQFTRRPQEFLFYGK